MGAPFQWRLRGLYADIFDTHKGVPLLSECPNWTAFRYPQLCVLHYIRGPGRPRRNQVMTKGARARRLRKIAQKRGFMLRKSRGPLSLDNHGEFMIVDPSRNVVVAGSWTPSTPP